MKIIGLDVGSKRIGVAKVDSSVRIAVPYGTVSVDGSELQQIASIARINDTNLFVLGLPRNSKGEETAQSQYVRDFAKKLKEFIPGAKISFQDESLTSVEAENRLKNRKKKYQKGEIDTEAATIILQDFIETHSGTSKTASFQKKIAKTDKTSKKKGKTLKKFLLILLALIVLAGVGGFGYFCYSLTPVSSADCINSTSGECEEIEFIVEEGDSLPTIASKLKNMGLIRDALVFRIQFKLKYPNEIVHSGKYALKRTMSIDEIIAQFVVGGKAVNVFSLTILPGDNIFKIKDKLAEQGYSREELDAAFSANYDHPVLQGRPEGASLEGYLFGDTYEFYKGEDLKKIITTALDAMYSFVQKENLVQKYEDRGLSLYEGITMASIVEKETSGKDDMAKTAQVFYARMKEDISLGSDVTVSYALDLVDPNRQVYTDNTAALSVDSPYNTRLHKGLPYGPICNPGKEALLAVANPADTTYLYFLTGDDGTMYYSYTEDEHLQKVSEYCHKLCELSL